MRENETKEDKDRKAAQKAEGKKSHKKKVTEEQKLLPSPEPEPTVETTAEVKVEPEVKAEPEVTEDQGPPDGACMTFGYCDPKDAYCLACRKDYPKAFEACMLASTRTAAKKSSTTNRTTNEKMTFSTEDLYYRQLAEQAAMQAAGKSGLEWFNRTNGKKGKPAGEKPLTEMIDEMFIAGGKLGDIHKAVLAEQAVKGGSRYKTLGNLIAHAHSRVASKRAPKRFLCAGELYIGDFDLKEVTKVCTAETFVQMQG